MNHLPQPKLVKPDVYPAVTRLVLSVLLTVLTLVGCGKGSDSENQVGTGHFVAPAELAPYVDEFLVAAENHGKPVSAELTANLEVVFDETLPATVAGRCEQWSNSLKKRIKVKPSLWAMMGEGSRQSVFFHELGHCFLGRSHDDSTVERDGKTHAASLMNSEIVRHEVFTPNREAYLSELFE